MKKCIKNVLIMRLIVLLAGISVTAPAHAFTLYTPGSGVNYTGFVVGAEGYGFSWPWTFTDSYTGGSATGSTTLAAYSANQKTYQQATTPSYNSTPQNTYQLASTQPAITAQTPAYQVPNTPYQGTQNTAWPAYTQANAYSNYNAAYAGYVFAPSYVSPAPICIVSPFWIFNAPTSVREGDAYTYTPTNNTGYKITYRVIDGPAGLTVHEKTGRISWTPGFNEAGTHAVRIGIETSRCERVENFTIQVENVR